MINKDSYPYLSIRRKKDCGKGILYIDIYRFKSTKSNIVYLVNVERYEHNMYAYKFYQKNHRVDHLKV